MTSKEIPPRDEVEKYEDTRILQPSEEKLSEQKAQEATERVIEEKGYLSQQDKARIAEIESSFKPDTSERIAEIHSIARQKPLGDETWSSSKSEYVAPKPYNTNKGVWGGLKRAALGLTALFGVTVASEAKGVEKNPSDSTKGNIEVNFNAARKVQEIAPDYTKVKKDNKTYGYKIENGSKKELPKATATAGSVETQAYINTLIKHLQNGISPEELVEEGYISSDRMEEFRKYYVAPKADVVYIESEQEQPKEVDGPQWAKMSNRYWLNNRAVGDGVFEVRKSDNKSQGGTDIDIYQPAFKLNFIYPNGEPTGESITIPGGEVQNYLVAGTTNFKSEQAYAEAMEKFGGKSIAYAFTGKEIADGTTLK